MSNPRVDDFFEELAELPEEVQKRVAELFAQNRDDEAAALVGFEFAKVLH